MLKSVFVLFLAVGCLAVQPGCGPQEAGRRPLPAGAIKTGDLTRTYAQVTRNGKIVGSGFFVEHRGRLATNTYFVTAGHVASNLLDHFREKPSLELRVRSGDIAPKAMGLRISLCPQEGHAYWLRHPSPAVDLAAFPVSLPENDKKEQGICPVVWDSSREKSLTVGFTVPTDAPYLLTQPFLDAYEVVPGREVVMLGAIAHLQGNLADPKEFLVSYRRGIISAMPSCDLWFSFGGYTRMFIVDCPVLPGDSGGPVFVSVGETLAGGQVIGGTPHLLGVAVSALDARKLLSGEGASSHLVGENSGLSLVVPAEQLAELLEDAEIRSVNLDRALFK